MRSVVVILTLAVLLFAGAGAAGAKYASPMPDNDSALTGSDVGLLARAQSEPAPVAGSAGAGSVEAPAAAAPAIPTAVAAEEGLGDLLLVLLGAAGGLLLAATAFFGMRAYEHRHARGLA